MDYLIRGYRYLCEKFHRVSLSRKETILNGLQCKFLEAIILKYNSYFEGKLHLKLSDIQDRIIHTNIFPNGWILTISIDGQMKVWDPENGNLIHHTVEHSRGIKCSLILSENEVCIPGEKGIEIWNIITCEVKYLNCEHVINKLVLCNGKIISSSYDHTIQVWEDGEYDVLGSHDEHITLLVGLNNGKIASRSLDGIIKIWDISKGECIAVFIGTNNHITIPHMVLSGDYLICNTQTLEIWDLNSGICSDIHIDSIDMISSMIIHEDKIILGLKNGKIEIRDLNGNLEHVMCAYMRTISHLLILNDGRLASSCNEGCIKIWNLNTCKCELTLKDSSYLNILPNGNLVTKLNIWK